MGYFIEDIANETKTPAKVSLSGNSNFIQFESKAETVKPVDISIEVKSCGYVYVNPGNGGIHFYDNISAFTIEESNTGIKHTFRGTSDVSEIGSNTFYLGSPWLCVRYRAAQALKDCLQKNEFIGNNFDVTLAPVEQAKDKLVGGTVLRIKSKGSGKNYAFKIIAADYTLLEKFFTVTGNPEDTTNKDSISNGGDPAEIQLEISKDTGVFPGEDGKPNSDNLGTYVTTLSKSYFGKPLWFDINTIWANQNKFSVLFSDSATPRSGWWNTGTVTDFRLVGKRFNGITNEAFYYSDVFYALTGHKRGLEQNDMTDYVYNTAIDNCVALPLTKQPMLTHVKGQTQYFNFVLSDKNRKSEKLFDMGIMYKIYTQSGSFIANVEYLESVQDIKKFDIVNTIELNVDSLIEMYPKAGIVKVFLCREGKLVSEPQTYNILPDCLYRVNDFAFLNSLGGWSSFNFGGMEQTEFKSDFSVIHKTRMPDNNKSSMIETVFNKDVTEQFVVQTMPIRAEVVDWLKELSSSIAVYELSTQRYIIVEELNVKHNSKDDLFTLQMKYHYSDSYN